MLNRLGHQNRLPREGSKITLKRGAEPRRPMYFSEPVYREGNKAVIYETGGKKKVIGEVVADCAPSKVKTLEALQKKDPFNLTIGKIYGADTLDGEIGITLSASGAHHIDKGPVTHYLLIRVKDKPNSEFQKKQI